MRCEDESVALPRNLATSPYSTADFFCMALHVTFSFPIVPIRAYRPFFGMCIRVQRMNYLRISEHRREIKKSISSPVGSAINNPLMASPLRRADP